MEVFSKPSGMRQWSRRQFLDNKRIAVVPTMGALHEGHLSLVREAHRCADAVVVTIYVNPTQFAPTEDLARYPRDEQRDLELCGEAGVNAVFLPLSQTMYAEDASTWVHEERMSKGLCGASRVNHFRGVCTVVAKLFNIVQPDVAVFGQKDFQQVAVVKRMVRDLEFPIEVVVCPTVREPDGLAMSSRNAYLTAVERGQAVALQRALRQAVAVSRTGVCGASDLRQAMVETLEHSGLRIDYVEIVKPDTLEAVKGSAQSGDIALLAVFCGTTRLIDNCIL